MLEARIRLFNQAQQTPENNSSMQYSRWHECVVENTAKRAAAVGQMRKIVRPTRREWKVRRTWSHTTTSVWPPRTYNWPTRQRATTTTPESRSLHRMLYHPASWTRPHTREQVIKPTASRIQRRQRYKTTTTDPEEQGRINHSGAPYQPKAGALFSYTKPGFSYLWRCTLCTFSKKSSRPF